MKSKKGRQYFRQQ